MHVLHSLTEKINVALVDDHPLILEALKSILSMDDDIQIVATGGCGDDVVNIALELEPDVMILDIRMPQSLKGQSKYKIVPTLQKIKRSQKNKQTKFILLSHHLSQVILGKTMKAGARGYILKEDSLSLKIPEAVKMVHAGGIFLSESISSIYFDEQHQFDDIKLTNIQIDLLRIIENEPDITYVQLSHMTDIGESAIKSSLHKAFKVLNVQNKTAAILQCQSIGIL